MAKRSAPKRHRKALQFRKGVPKSVKWFCKNRMKMHRTDLRRYVRAGRWWQKHRHGLPLRAVSYWTKAARHAKRLLRTKKHKHRSCD
jgi:hypothetical protein